MEKYIYALFCFIFLNCTLENGAQKIPVVTYMAKAHSLAAEGKTQEASAAFVIIMENDPGNRDAVKGWLLLNVKKDDSGQDNTLTLLRNMGEVYPRNTAIILIRAFLETEKGLNKEALEDYNKLVKLEPDSALYHLGKGQVLYSMKRYKEALKPLNTAIRLNPEIGDAWGFKASALARRGKLNDAIVTANKGLRFAPNDPVIIYNRACIYSLTGDGDKALSDLRRAISISPGLKKFAREDIDFKNLYDNDEFKKLTTEQYY